MTIHGTWRRSFPHNPFARRVNYFLLDKDPDPDRLGFVIHSTTGLQYVEHTIDTYGSIGGQHNNPVGQPCRRTIADLIAELQSQYQGELYAQNQRRNELWDW